MENRIIAGWFVLLFLCQCTNQTDEFNWDNLMITPGMCLPDVADKYVFPIVSGTEEWKKLESQEEVLKVYQIPDDVLKTISTPGLIRSFLDIPLWWNDFYLSSVASRIATFNRIYPNYNSAVEYLNRKDASEVLLLYFDAMGFDCLKKQEEIDRMDWDEQVREAGKQMHFTSQFTAIQAFFVQQKILDQLDYENKQKAVFMLLSKYEQIQKLNIEGFHDPAAIEAMACMMYHAQYLPVVEYFDTRQHFDITADKVGNIISFAKQFIR
jgi:hypothetical protein